MKTLLRIALVNGASIVAGFILYVLSFRLDLGGEILFYRGVLLAIATAILLAGILVAAARKWPIDPATIVSGVLTSLSFNICFLVLLPVTIDRSITVFLLAQIEANEGSTADELQARFEDVYLQRMQQIPRRIREQHISGNIDVASDGSITVTGRGARFNELARGVADWFGTDRRFVDPAAAQKR